MKISLKALLVSGAAMILTSAVPPLRGDDSLRSSAKSAAGGASLDDLIGGINDDNAYMGMNPPASSCPEIPPYDRDHRRGSDHSHRQISLPVLVTNPSIIQPEMVSSMASTSPLTPPDFNRMLADLHVRLAEDRDLLSRQFLKGGITQDQYDDDRKALDQLADVERSETNGGSGSLSRDQIVDLSRRLEEIHKRILKDLAS